MKPSAPERLVGTWVGALAALLACGLLAPSQAQASCSSYVLHRLASGELADHLDPAVAGLDSALLDEASSPDGPRRPAPCSGPSCSGRSEAPEPPPVSATRFVEPWAYLAPLESRPAIDSAPLAPPSCDLGPIHRGESIYHPPRRPSASPIV